MTGASFEEATAELLDSKAPLDARIRALYVIKQKRDEEAVGVLMSAIDTTDSVLLQHEILYNLGQFGKSDECLRRLEDVASSVDRYNEVSRHEAVEAIGAIGRLDSVPFLNGLAKAQSDNAPVRESCELAVYRIELRQKIGAEAFNKLASPEFGSVDPAPATEGARDVASLKATLMDTSSSLFDRYRAMFALRDLNNTASATALGEVLREDKSSCLLRHEVAFVLGQMEAPATIPALAESLKDVEEHGMVRHESAEALGAMADAKTWDLLAHYAKDSEAIVADSCIVALEMHKYWSQWKAPAATTDGEQDATAVAA